MPAGKDKCKRTLDRYNELIKRNSHERAIHELAIEFGKKEATIKRRLSEARKLEVDAINITVKGNVVNIQSDEPILVMPDIHAPYHHPDTIEFLKWVQEHRGCRERVVSVGDLMDFHAQSRHTTETDAPSATSEYEKACKFVSELTEAFPYGDMVLGNHDLIPQRQMSSIGLDASMLKCDNELYHLPDGWTVHPHYYVIDEWDVQVEHGIGSSGKYGCANTAKEKRCSYVQGHTHSAAAVIYMTNHNSTIFGLNVGCLVDSSSLAQRYGKYMTRKGCLGCGVVYSGSHAEFVPMQSWPGFRG